eukprot:256967_1
MYDNNAISYNQRILLLVSFIISTCLCFIITILFCYYVYCKSQCCKYQKNVILASIRHTTILGLILFFLSGLALCAVSYYDESYVIFKISDVCSIIFWSTSQFCVYYLFMVRLSHTFEETAYQLRKTHFIILLIGIMLFLLIEYAVAVSWLLFYVGIIPRTLIRLIDLSLTFSAVIADLICSTALTYLFTSRLIKVTIELAHTDINRSTQQGEQFIHITVRYFMLSCFATVTTQIFLLIFTISDIAYLIDSNSDYYVMFENIGFELWSLNNAVNAICIFLNINFTHNIYRICCKQCHILCVSCFKRNIEKKIYMKQLMHSPTIDSDKTDKLHSSFIRSSTTIQSSDA